MLAVTIRHLCLMTIAIKFVMISTNVRMVTRNVVTMGFVQIPKVLITVAVDMDLAEIHRRRVVNQWREFVRMVQFAIEMPK